MSDFILKDTILTHKKFQIAIITSLSLFLVQLASAWDQNDSFAIALLALNYTQIIAPILVAIGAQGLADFRKDTKTVEIQSFYNIPTQSWLPGFLKRKKFQVALLTAIGVLLAQFAGHYADQQSFAVALLLINWTEVTAPILLAITAQGFSDFGKEAKKVETRAYDLRSRNSEPDLPDRLR